MSLCYTDKFTMFSETYKVGELAQIISQHSKTKSDRKSKDTQERKKLEALFSPMVRAYCLVKKVQDYSTVNFNSCSLGWKSRTRAMIDLLFTVTVLYTFTC